MLAPALLVTPMPVWHTAILLTFQNQRATCRLSRSAGACTAAGKVNPVSRCRRARDCCPARQVHASVFAAADGDPGRDARVALAAARRRVLAGVRLCFSAVVPLGAAAPRAHPLWRLAEEVRGAHGGRLLIEQQARRQCLPSWCSQVVQQWVVGMLSYNITHRTAVVFDL